MLKVFLDWSTGNGAFIRKYSISLYLRFTLSLAPFNLQQDSSISLQPLLARLYPLVLPFLSPILAARASFCIDVFHSPLLSSPLLFPRPPTLARSLSLSRSIPTLHQPLFHSSAFGTCCLFIPFSLLNMICLLGILPCPSREERFANWRNTCVDRCDTRFATIIASSCSFKPFSAEQRYIVLFNFILG